VTGEFCEWPNPAAPRARGAAPLPSKEERLAAWLALDKPAKRGPKPSGMAAWGEGIVYKLLERNIILWEGPSAFTGAPIYVIASGKTSNRKIGAMVQLWILTAMAPIDAVTTGADDAICGDCKLRGDGTGAERACYVEWWRAPSNIHQAATGTGKGKGIVDRMTPEAFAERVRGMQLRIGAYGDPAAVPLEVWRPMLATAKGWTAYTHQWRTCDPGYREFCMASVDSPAERLEAAALGYRTFRVRRGQDGVDSGEVVCPASDEAHHKATCASCSLCRGAARPAKSVVIVAHGQRAKWFPLLLRKS
jgi:hypothetical protein